MTLPRLFRLLAVLAPVLALAATAAAQVTIITTVPYTITASGKYRLGTNLFTPTAGQTCLTVAAPNVILDLGGYFVSGPAGATTSTSAAILVNDVSNVTIRNGTVANQGYGIRYVGTAANSINHLVENLNVTRCYISGIYMGASSAGTILRDNTFSQIGGATVNAPTSAISTAGGVRIEDNAVTSVVSAPAFNAIGISLGAGDFAIGNTVAGCTFGIVGGKYLNNLTLNCGNAFFGGTNAIGNN